MALPNDTLRIDTPENVTFQYQVAGIGSRFLAALVDTALIALLQILGLIGILGAFGGLGSLFTPSGGFARTQTWILALSGMILFIFFWGYYIFFEIYWNGQSPGKRLAKLRVIRSDGSPVTPSESVIRNLVRLIDFLPVYYGIGVIVMFLNEQSRRLGDMAAGTLVVHARETITLDSLAGPTVTAAPALDLAIERLSANDVQTVEEFINRRTELYNRRDLALHIAATLAERMDIPTPVDSGEAEVLIMRTLKAVRWKQVSS